MREFKIGTVGLVTDRGVAVAQATRDLDLAKSMLRPADAGAYSRSLYR